MQAMAADCPAMPVKSAAFWRKGSKTVCFKSSILKRTLKQTPSGYAMVRHAARMVRAGDLGEVKVVQAEHASGWAKADGKAYPKAELGFPDATDGVIGVAFVESAMRSYAAGGAWTPVEAI
jgi:hypothetical protein